MPATRTTVSVDLSALLVILLAVGAVILILDGVLWAPRRRRQGGAKAQPSALVLNARSLLPIVFIVLVVRSFILEPFRIPSASMMPGLVDGDFIVVNKFSYGLRLPLANTKILSTGSPQRGDVIVFRLPRDPSTHLIKRLIGLPGDHVTVRANRVTVNGHEMPLQPDGVFSGGFGFDGAALGRESFGGRAHELMFAPGLFATDFDTVVPAGSYFFMGDNRNDSKDSRFADVGFVPEANLVGRAVRIWMNWRFSSWPNLRRIGKAIV
jgi:signal peptidase I